MSDDSKNLEQLCVNTIRMLSADMVEAANSGHPGLPLGMAPIAYVLWTEFMRHNPADPAWPNRDRFILSPGHGSAMLYSMLHLTGYDLSLEELKAFRQWGSKTPGHPEYGHTPGVETTTGPLGQGFANGVGMAIAERYKAKTYNRDGHKIVDHYIYAVVSDGDLMEGVACEAASLAGRLKLGKLIYVYDDNKVTIEGMTDIAFTEDVAKRFDAYGWHVTRVADGNDLDALRAAIKGAQADERPSIIVTRTEIGYGSPKAGTPKAHGEPLGADALRATKQNLGWPLEPTFFIPDQALAEFRKAAERGEKFEKQWKVAFRAYRADFPAEAAEFQDALRGKLPADWDADVPVYNADSAAAATRNIGGEVMNALAPRVTNLIGGSADLAPSTKTLLKGFDDRNIHFGVREHAMGAIVNGLALYGGLIPFGATFAVFADYMRPTIRLAALMDVQSIFIFTHDSIGVGEDGPTHQPVEQIASLRAIPNLAVFRPADANETACAWKAALERRGPSALFLTRQKLPPLDPAKFPVAEGVKKGGYVLSDCDGTPQVILVATGSEVSVALEAQAQLAADGVKARVVSIPSFELFRAQTRKYRNQVLPPKIKKRVAVEAGVSMGWREWIGNTGVAVCLDHFGASAPGPTVMEKFGFSAENVAAKAKALL